MNTSHSYPGEEKPLRKNPWRWMMILAVIFVVVGIIIGIVLLRQPRQLMLTETDAGNTVQAHPGDYILIRLSANATTGFSWAIDKADASILTLQRASYTPEPGGAVGGGGTAVFTFIAQRAGTVHLRLKYWRSWEGDSSIVKRYGVTIQVQGE